jgi:hypothetical protein
LRRPGNTAARKRMTKYFTFLVGQSCRSALNSWAAEQRRPTDEVKIFVLHPPPARLRALGAPARVASFRLRRGASSFKNNQRAIYHIVETIRPRAQSEGWNDAGRDEHAGRAKETKCNLQPESL